ncbi:MAG: hypothetical protein GXO77_15715, partial [Calditrichaeota bacterium]|nr:hypothetical protein [Calditrichota bacterium]
MKHNQNFPYFHAVKYGTSKKKVWRTFFALQITKIEDIYVNENSFEQRKIIGTRLQLRQIDLINTLYQPDKIHSIEYRFHIIPQLDNGIFQNIEIYVILSTDHITKNGSLKQATENFKSIISIMQSSSNLYDIESINDEKFFLKIFDLPKKYRFVHELRRRVSRFNQKSIIPKSKLSLLPTENVENKEESRSIYVVHPFIPKINGYENLFKLFSRVEMPMLISIRISPIRIRKDEDQYFIDSIRECENIIKRDIRSPKFNKEQAEILARILLSHYLSLQDAPFQMHIFTASEKKTPFGLVELFGTEITR